MANCGWTRLAYLLYALTILIALAQLGNPSADPRSLASVPPGGATTGGNPPAAEVEPREPAQTAASGEAAVQTAFVVHDEGDYQSTATVDDAPGAAGTGPPVFHRPAPASPPPEPGDETASDPVCGDLAMFPSDRRIVFPLPREYLHSYEDTWGAPRPQGGHEGTDLMVPTGTAEYAVTDGTIVPVAGANGNGWNTLGGYAVMLEAAYSVGPVKKGDLFYYAHLNREGAREIGTRVQAGQTVGYAGDTGQGPEVTRGLFPPHLHLGWYDASAARSGVTSGAMNPYPLLEWIKASGGAITGGSDARYCETPRTGDPTPSTGESRWPAPASPGVSPDLDTGSNDLAPSPAVENHEPQNTPASGAAPAQQEGPPPAESSGSTPERAAPKTDPRTTGPSSSGSPNPPAPRDTPPPGNGVPGDEPPPAASDGASSQDRSDAPIPRADPEVGETNDHPDEDGGEENGEDAKDAPEVRVEEPENKGSQEDSQRPDEPSSPTEHQYAPETGAEGDPETTAAE